MDEFIYARGGQVVARIQRDADGGGCTVFSAGGQLLGRCRNGSTYSASGQMLAHGEHPGLLVERGADR